MFHAQETKVLAILTVVGVISFAVQNALLAAAEAMLFQAYAMNFMVAALLFLLIYRLRVNHPDKLGFVFMLGSGIKFTLFFVFFNPSIQFDGVTSKAEFLSFFVPYALSTFIETTALIRLLNKE
jgi:hypothetical protein